MSVDFDEFYDKYGLLFKDYFAKELISLNDFVKDGIVEVLGKRIKITETGKYFLSYVCAVFDRYIQ